ncbi:MAG: hypothetical protein ACFFEX_07305 [Candidatus Thorarchaeota archaeon]
MPSPIMRMMLSPSDSDAVQWLFDETNVGGANITNKDSNTRTIDIEDRLAALERVIIVNQI